MKCKEVVSDFLELFYFSFSKVRIYCSFKYDDNNETC
jgi:hypothetical protein